MVTRLHLRSFPFLITVTSFVFAFGSISRTRNSNLHFQTKVRDALRKNARMRSILFVRAFKATPNVGQRCKIFYCFLFLKNEKTGKVTVDVEGADRQGRNPP